MYTSLNCTYTSYASAIIVLAVLFSFSDSKSSSEIFHFQIEIANNFVIQCNFKFDFFCRSQVQAINKHMDFSIIRLELYFVAYFHPNLKL
jgi:hypothetical protein